MTVLLRHERCFDTRLAFDPTGRGIEQAGEQAQHGALAAAVGTNERHRRRRVERCARPVERDEVSVADRDVVEAREHDVTVAG